MKALAPAAVSSIGKVRTVAKKKEQNTILPPANFLLSVIIQNSSGRRPLH